jgi:ParB-like chromosome segregation protein Spo0J
MTLRITKIPTRAYVRRIAVNRIHRPPTLRVLTSHDLNPLLDSIKKHGMLSPILVYKSGPKQYTLLDGHCRVLCAIRLHMRTIKAKILPNKEILYEEVAKQYHLSEDA